MADPQATRPRLLTPTLFAVFGATSGGMVSFFLLLSVAPLYATATGGGESAAGAVTGALLLATVAAELVTPRLLVRFGARLVFAVGLVLLGAPAFALPVAADPAVVIAVSALRGIGFGFVVVLGSTLVAQLVPAERRGEGLGLLGLVMSVPGVLFLPFGVFLVDLIGYPVVFVAGAVASLLGLAAAPGLPGRVSPDAPRVGIRRGLRMPEMRRPAVVFAATAMAAGVVVTFIPLAVGGSGRLAALALLVQAVTLAATRWWAGWYGDRHGPARLMLPALLATAGGILLLVLVDQPVALLLAMALFGGGFGAIQNASLASMFRRVPPAGYAMVGAVWNLAYDAAMGLGAIVFGLLVVYTGYSWGFLLTGALMLLALAPAWWDRRAASRPPAADPS
ncbi:MFS transporter [Natronosporangium hydrolyticum]|uniref:MFS transporter n=1 Tax=Natronosporangium hydrolyticum TaxID=2811111 RepID=A0A895YCR7_9ACTN|nr:MFS transporter [Natronosporangium hydrolyticum]QSB14005.1 MFS transporter [Natronosporangium hydrolyticum]